MAFKVSFRGVEVVCETAEELEIALSLSELQGDKRDLDQVRGKQGDGPKRAWDAARQYATEHDCTVDEARKYLAREKKRRMAAALLDDPGQQHTQSH